MKPILLTSSVHKPTLNESHQENVNKGFLQQEISVLEGINLQISYKIAQMVEGIRYLSKINGKIVQILRSCSFLNAWENHSSKYFESTCISYIFRQSDGIWGFKFGNQCLATTIHRAFEFRNHISIQFVKQYYIVVLFAKKIPTKVKLKSIHIHLGGTLRVSQVFFKNA